VSFLTSRPRCGLAIERVFPDLPHQLCQYHYLRDAALPLCDADRAFKKQLKQKLRGLRDVERQVAAREDVEADITRRYCLALREVLRDDGKYPLEPPGLQLYDKLQQIDASLARAIARRASTRLQRLRTLLAGVTALAKEHARLVIAWVWLYNWRSCWMRAQRVRRQRRPWYNMPRACRTIRMKHSTNGPRICGN
jgi:hypothetical protein